jgi:very-short-patch-repair endonuclease
VLDDHAAEQAGAFSRKQATAAGFNRWAVQRRVAGGLWLPRPEPGVLRLPSHPVTWHQDCWAALLAAGHSGALSHRTAAAHWGLDGISPRGRVSIVVPPSGAHRLGPVRVHRVELEPGDRRTHNGWSLTSPELTLIQLAATADVSASTLEDATESAFRLGLTSPRRLANQLDRRPRAGTKRLRALLAKRPEGRPRHSQLETAFLRVVRAGGLADPVPQHEVRIGTKRYFIDWAYPEWRIAIELDGFESHSTRAAFESDRVRQNDLVLAGWTLLRFTPRQIEGDPASVVATLLRAAAA